jgi:predicted nucleic-acid-binding protein
LIESHWRLCNVCRMSLPEWLAALAELSTSLHIGLDWCNVVRSAVQVCRSSKAGFVDALIAQVAKAAGCGQTVSFDKVAVRFAGMEAV